MCIKFLNILLCSFLVTTTSFGADLFKFNWPLLGKVKVVQEISNKRGQSESSYTVILRKNKYLNIKPINFKFLSANGKPAKTTQEAQSMFELYNPEIVVNPKTGDYKSTRDMGKFVAGFAEFSGISIEEIYGNTDRLKVLQSIPVKNWDAWVLFWKDLGLQKQGDKIILSDQSVAFNLGGGAIEKKIELVQAKPTKCVLPEGCYELEIKTVVSDDSSKNALLQFMDDVVVKPMDKSKKIDKMNYQETRYAIISKNLRPIYIDIKVDIEVGSGKEVKKRTDLSRYTFTW